MRLIPSCFTSLRIGSLALAAACGLLALSAPIAAASAAETPWQYKVDPWVLETAARGATEFLVILENQADLSSADTMASKEARGRYVFERLRETAAATQPTVLAELAALDAETKPFWIANMIWVRGDQDIAEAMARRSDVHRVSANPWVEMDTEAFDRNARTPDGACPPGDVEAGIDHTGAPAFWAAGFDGSGAVVGGQDTGYDWEHEALQTQYRGWNGSEADHNYNWHDSIHSGGGVCGADSPFPCDDHGHGTHTAGTMVGTSGASMIGMAPGAEWIGCRNMDQGNGTPATYSECFEFFLAPTDSNGINPNPAMAPDVINNSWGCPPSEGCTDPNVMRLVVENVRTAGIVVVVSAGNSGSSCSSVNWPASIYDASFTVGATTVSDTIASFSSRGPVTVDGSNRLKPDISAPGVSVCSSFPGDTYGSISGTSMAGPHVAGLVALLISAQPCLRGQVDLIEQYILDTAQPLTTSQTCGGIAGSEVPNNTFGHGGIRAVIPGPEVCFGGTIFADGFESGDIFGWSGESAGRRPVAGR
ncbi:MAG: S8 family serine peptidase [Acidobacteriota bacterium]